LGTNQILDLVADVTLLQWILKKQDARVWARFKWLGVGSRVVSGAWGNETLGSIRRAGRGGAERGGTLAS